MKEKKLSIRVTEAEYAQLEMECRAANCRTISAYVRQKLTKNVGQTPKTSDKSPEKVNPVRIIVGQIEPETVEKPQESRGFDEVLETSPKIEKLKQDAIKEVRKRTNPCKVYGRHDMALLDGKITCRRCGYQA